MNFAKMVQGPVDKAINLFAGGGTVTLTNSLETPDAVTGKTSRTTETPIVAPVVVGQFEADTFAGQRSSDVKLLIPGSSLGTAELNESWTGQLAGERAYPIKPIASSKPDNTLVAVVVALRKGSPGGR